MCFARRRCLCCFAGRVATTAQPSTGKPGISAESGGGRNVGDEPHEARRLGEAGLWCKRRRLERENWRVSAREEATREARRRAKRRRDGKDVEQRRRERRKARPRGGRRDGGEEKSEEDGRQSRET
ncbi:hypothetical protein HDV57DRAFT_31462 [Trichoderma longibrachiatum]|uniref:Uncharacterized protein n=1 Tax=Trichoderma longibrachiatum ATCC 18648 TaxID=983965 RepID=A0A2T4CI22_TRILO|nr:hypothetical protein M440DRAFT_1009365 [Trichoderma longibrachiatum ATCC 18648]